MKTQKEIEDKLTELEKFCADENFTIGEIEGQIQALKFTLDRLEEEDL